MPIINVLAVVPASDFHASLQWYEKLVGARGERPMAGENVAEWQLTGAGGLQLIENPAVAGTVHVTIGVDDIDSRVAALASVGLHTNEPTTRDGIRIAIISDPDGNQITFADEVASTVGASS